MRTLTIAPTPVDCSSISIDVDTNDEFCIERPDNPDIGLCGSCLEGPAIPDREIPDENLCLECVAIREGRLNR